MRDHIYTYSLLYKCIDSQQASLFQILWQIHKLSSTNILLRITGFVEKDVTGLRRLLHVRRETIEIFYCCRIYLINNIIIKYQPESVGFHNGDVVSSEKRMKQYSRLDQPGCANITCWVQSRSVWPQPQDRTFCPGWGRHQKCWTAGVPGGTPPGVRPGMTMRQHGHKNESLTLICLLYCSTYLNLLRCSARIVGSLLTLILLCAS